MGCVGKKVLYIQAIFIFISGITSYNFFTSIVFKINTDNEDADSRDANG